MNEADSPDQQPGLPVPIEPASIPTVIESIATEATQPACSEGWQTVDFPGATSVDAIPQTQVNKRQTEGWSQPEALDASGLQGVIHYSSAAISPAITYSATSGETVDGMMQLQQLQQENVALRDRLVQVEQALVQQTEEPLVAAGNTSHSCEPTPERLEQLLQELERSHQTVQRQQILVETLTEQLGSSQERIAQLERDCALTQQRHNEQVQHVMQAESNCRDLRLRLHRQQQQTLQFKAALEKSLEMPTPYGNPVTPEVALASDATIPDALSAFLPKNSPVKPWSLTEKASQALVDQANLPRLFKLLNHGSLAQGDAIESAHALAAHDGLEPQAATPFSDRPHASETVAAEPTDLLDQDDPQFVTHLMQLIFPTTTDASLWLTAEALPAEPLDPSSVADADLAIASAEDTGLLTPNGSSTVTFLSPDRPSVWVAASPDAVEEHQPNAVPVSVDTIASTAPTPLPDTHSTDPLWDHLATLIDPVPAERAHLAAATSSAGSDEEGVPAQASMVSSHSPDWEPLEQRSLPNVPISTTAIPPFFAAADPLAESLSEDAATPAQTAWTWRDRLVSAGKNVRSTATEQAAQTAMLTPRAADRQSVPQPARLSSQPALTPTSFAVTPSPLVYPQRSTKKLASLAAVDLPTFPKR